MKQLDHLKGSTIVAVVSVAAAVTVDLAGHDPSDYLSLALVAAGYAIRSGVEVTGKGKK